MPSNNLESARPILRIKGTNCQIWIVLNNLPLFKIRFKTEWNYVSQAILLLLTIPPKPSAVAAALNDIYRKKFFPKTPLVWTILGIDQCQALDIFSFTSLAYPYHPSCMVDYSNVNRINQSRYIISVFTRHSIRLFHSTAFPIRHKRTVYQHTYKIWNEFKYRSFDPPGYQYQNRSYMNRTCSANSQILIEKQVNPL